MNSLIDIIIIRIGREEGGKHGGYYVQLGVTTIVSHVYYDDTGAMFACLVDMWLPSMF